MKDRFIELYQHFITRPGADKLLSWLETTDFFEAPASTRFHLARPGGLVEHSIHVYHRLGTYMFLRDSVQRTRRSSTFLTERRRPSLYAVCCMTSARPTSTPWR